MKALTYSGAVTRFYEDTCERTPILFLALEDKEYMSLYPIWEEISKRRKNCKLIRFSQFCDGNVSYKKGGLGELLAASFPIIVTATPGSTYIWMKALRPRWSYYFLGVEHGVAPFKKFTYSDAFCHYDDYIAPTALWKDRLERLFPNARTRFHLGGYPKATTYRKLLEKKNDTSEVVSCGGKTIVVIFSWGIRSDILDILPDNEGVTYLFHPSQSGDIPQDKFENAVLLRSSSDVTVEAISKADMIFGDLSSLTFEVCRMRETYLCLDYRLYIDDYDVERCFIDSDSEQYGCVPHTDVKITRDFIFSFEELCDALNGKNFSDRKSLSQCPSLDAIFPEDIPDKCSDIIVDIANRLDKYQIHTKSEMPDVEAAEFVCYAYRTILGRDPDSEGFGSYINRLRTTEGVSRFEEGLRILTEIVSSAEARERSYNYKYNWPYLKDLISQGE